MRYIEVLAHVRMERQAEGYEAVLELNTTAGKKIACFDQAFALRDAIVGLLKDAGLKIGMILFLSGKTMFA